MDPKDYRRIKKELSRCQRENAALRRQVASLRKNNSEYALHQDTPPFRGNRKRGEQAHILALLRSRRRRAHHYDKPTYLRFLIDCFTDSTFYTWWTRVLSYVRRIRLVRTIGLILVLVFTAVQTSALFVVFSAVYLTLLPFLVLSSGLGLLASVLHARTVNRRLQARLAGQHIRILLPSRAVDFTPDAQPFFFASARQMATEPKTAVIVVSPYAWSTKGFRGHRMFVTARHEGDGLYLVRKYYYFILRRQVLDTLDPHLSILY